MKKAMVMIAVTLGALSQAHAVKCQGSGECIYTAYGNPQGSLEVYGKQCSDPDANGFQGNGTLSTSADGKTVLNIPNVESVVVTCVQ